MKKKTGLKKFKKKNKQYEEEKQVFMKKTLK